MVTGRSLAPKAPRRPEPKKKPRGEGVQPEVAEEVMRMMTVLSAKLREHRDREGLRQDELGPRLGLSPFRYADLERLQKINPEFGCNLALLIRVAQEWRITLPELMNELQGKRQQSSGRTEIEEDLIAAFNEVPFEKKEAFVDQCQSSESESFAQWAVGLALDMKKIPAKHRLKIEMDIQYAILDTKNLPEEEREARRTHLLSLMEESLAQK